jgi:hypothetical protein
MESEGLLGKIEIFFCPQGNTREEWLEAYTFGMFEEWIDVIGFSKIAVPNAWLDDYKDDQGIKEARWMAYDYLKAEGALVKPIHCLGQGDPCEFTYYNHPMMRSTDSVYPVWAAINGQDFREDTTTRTPTPHKLLETYDMKDVNMELVKKNIEYLRFSCMDYA